MLGQSHMPAGSPGAPFLQSARRCHVGAFAAHAKGSGTCQKVHASFPSRYMLMHVLPAYACVDDCSASSPWQQAMQPPLHLVKPLCHVLQDEFLSMGLPELVADSLSRPRAPRAALARDFALAYLKQGKELLQRTAELGALCKEMQSLTMRYLATQNRLSVRGVLGGTLS